MDTISFESITYQQPYFNVPNSLKRKLTSLLGHRLMSMWLDLYYISHNGKKTIQESYCYLAKIWGCSRRHAIRIAKQLEKLGCLIIKTFKRGFKMNDVNKYQVRSPEEVLKEISLLTQRKRQFPKIDYSVTNEYGVDDNTEIKQIMEHREISTAVSSTKEYPKEGDTRNLLNSEHKPNNFASKLLEGMKEKFIGRKLSTEEKPKEPYYGWGGSDKTVTDLKLHIKSFNKASPINYVDHEKKPEKKPRHVPEWIKKEALRFINNQKFISDKQSVFKECLYFMANNHMYTPTHSLNVFKKLIRQDKWRTPISMRYEQRESYEEDCIPDF